MPLTPLRKRLNFGFGVAVLAFAAVLLWPLVSRPLELRAFCADLRAGLSHGAIRNLADQKGFKVSAQRDGAAHVYDLQSLGKFSCKLRLQGDALVTSRFGFTE